MEINEGQYPTTRCHKIGSGVKWGKLYTLNNGSCKVCTTEVEGHTGTCGGSEIALKHATVRSRTIMWTLIICTYITLNVWQILTYDWHFINNEELGYFQSRQFSEQPNTWTYIHDHPLTSLVIRICLLLYMYQYLKIFILLQHKHNFEQAF
jgi:hypothetical protein